MLLENDFNLNNPVMSSIAIDSEAFLNISEISVIFHTCHDFVIFASFLGKVFKGLKV
jgi:hypothetical protein